MLVAARSARPSDIPAVTVHLATCPSDPERLEDTVGDDVAATCAAMDLLLTELRGQRSLRYLRIDLNVLATTCSPLDRPAPLLGNEAVCRSIDLLTGGLRALLDVNSGIK